MNWKGFAAKADEAKKIKDAWWRVSGISQHNGKKDAGRASSRFDLAMLEMQRELIKLYRPLMDSQSKHRADATLAWLRDEIKTLRRRVTRAEIKQAEAA